MFLRKIASRKLKLRKKKKESNEKVLEPIVEPLYYEEPAPKSAESSEVEYIEDDDEYLQDNTASRVHSAVAEANNTEKDDILFRSVCIPTKNGSTDDVAHDGILAKLPSNLEEKQHHACTTGSHSEEEHLTHVTESVTGSESCSASMAWDRCEAKEKKRLEDWRLLVEKKMTHFGPNNPRTLACLLEVGMNYLQHEDFDGAKEYFAKAVAMSEKILDGPDLRKARALELYSIVAVADTNASEIDEETLHRALLQLDKAFAIRLQLQGPTHIDTVDTLNRIASVHSSLKEFERARDSFFEVFKMREAIFGSFHPSLATSARALALAHKQLNETDKARFYFKYGLKTCERNGMEPNSNLVKVLRKDIYDLKTEKERFVV